MILEHSSGIELYYAVMTLEHSSGVELYYAVMTLEHSSGIELYAVMILEDFFKFFNPIGSLFYTSTQSNWPPLSAEKIGLSLSHLVQRY